MTNISRRADWHRLPTENPDRRFRERLAAIFITLSYIIAFMLGALCYALLS